VRIIILIFILVCNLNTYSQEQEKGLYFGISLYPNISNGFANESEIDSEYYTGFESTKFSYSAGLSIGYQFEKYFGITSGINFMETGDKSLLYAPDLMRGFIFERQYRQKELFLELPINFSKILGNNWLIKGGGSLLFNLKHKRRIDVAGVEGNFNNITSNENSKLGVTFNLGFGYIINLSEQQQLEIAPYAQYNFINPLNTYWFGDSNPARKFGSIGIQVNYVFHPKND
jgi:Outer membrane protein beta-barrel domain